MDIDIKEYIAPVLKWWWLIFLSTLLAGGTSFYVARQQPPLYSTTATIIVGNAIENPNPSNVELNITQQLAAFYVDLAKRPSVRNAAREALGISQFPNEIFVQQLNNTNVIDITVRHTNPALAQAAANELARQLTLRSPTARQDVLERQEFINRQLNNYETAIQDAEQQIAEKQAQLATLISAREIRQVQNEIATLTTALQTLRRDYTNLLANTQAGATNTIRIIEQAPLPRNPINSNYMLTVITAAGLGLVLAVVAAYALELLDDTVKLPSQVERLTSLPVLGGIAQIRGDNLLVATRQVRSPTAEAFRVLRTGIQFSAVDSPRRALLVTSPTPFDGKSTISANLAVVFAQAGNRVLLIDADLRRPTQHLFFNLPNKRGLTNILVDFEGGRPEEQIMFPIEEVMQETSVPGLFLLSSGPIPPNPAELLGSIKMHHLIEFLLAQFDYVLLDSAPVLSVTDSVLLSTQVDGVVLVLRANKSRRAHVRQAVQALRDVRAMVIGTILNDLKVRSEGFGSYYYYTDPYTYGDEQTDEKRHGPGQALRRLWPNKGVKVGKAQG